MPAMATIDRVLPSIPQRFNAAASLQSLDRLSSARKGGSRSGRFLEQLRAQAEVGTIAARLLRDAITAGDPRLAAAPLDECRRKAREIDQSLVREVSATVITPFDCEDLQGMSRRVRHIIESVAETGERLMTAEASHRQWLPLQQKVLDTAEVLARAMNEFTRDQDIVDATRALWVHGREMRELHRTIHVELIRTAAAPISFLADDSVSRRYSVVGVRFRDVNLALRRAKLKNG
ncbi:MAG: hypothetical protein R2762_20735 [Bryobacteraceae bacterium]